MGYEDWKDKIEDFPTADVRNKVGNFFPGLKRRAELTPVHGGLHVVQTFEPLPLYEVMADLGFERHTDKVADDEWHVYFYRVENREDPEGIAIAPASLLTMPLVDNDLTEPAVTLWDLTWGAAEHALPFETRLLVGLANNVGAGMFRQATRDLLRAYALGVESDKLSEVFKIFIWNQGIGYFSSEISGSALFAAFKLIRQAEARGVSRKQICADLEKKFGERNPDVKIG